MEELRCDAVHEFEPVAWDQLAAELEGSVFHTHGWVESQSRAFGGRPLFVRWLGDGDRTVAIAAGVQRPDPKSMIGRFVSVVRFDSPPAARGFEADFVGALLDWARAGSVVDLRFGSFDGVDRAWGSLLAQPTARLEFVLGPAPGSQLREGMHKRTRRYISRAQALGIRVQSSTDRDQIAAFVALHASMLARLKQRKGDTIPSSVDMARLTDRIEWLIRDERAKLYLAFDGDEPISGCLFGVFGTTAYWFLSGTNERALEVRATPLALWHAVGELSEAGYTRVNLGGVPAEAQEPSSADHGLYQFKLGLGADPVPCTSGESTLRPLRMAVVRVIQRARRGAPT